jgi:hypothetical protein
MASRRLALSFILTALARSMAGPLSGQSADLIITNARP